MVLLVTSTPMILSSWAKCKLKISFDYIFDHAKADTIFQLCFKWLVLFDPFGFHWVNLESVMAQLGFNFGNSDH